MRKTEKPKRKSTIIRENLVHTLHKELKEKYGNKTFNNLSKTFIYEEISSRTGLSERTISNIINHTTPSK